MQNLVGEFLSGSVSLCFQLCSNFYFELTEFFPLLLKIWQWVRRSLASSGIFWCFWTFLVIRGDSMLLLAPLINLWSFVSFNSVRLFLVRFAPPPLCWGKAGDTPASNAVLYMINMPLVFMRQPLLDVQLRTCCSIPVHFIRSEKR